MKNMTPSNYLRNLGNSPNVRQFWEFRRFPKFLPEPDYGLFFDFKNLLNALKAKKIT